MPFQKVKIILAATFFCSSFTVTILFIKFFESKNQSRIPQKLYCCTEPTFHQTTPILCPPVNEWPTNVLAAANIFKKNTTQNKGQAAAILRWYFNRCRDDKNNKHENKIKISRGLLLDLLGKPYNSNQNRVTYLLWEIDNPQQHYISLMSFMLKNNSVVEVDIGTGDCMINRAPADDANN